MPRAWARAACLAVLLGGARATREAAVVEGEEQAALGGLAAEAAAGVGDWTEAERNAAYENLWEFMALNGFDFARRDIDDLPSKDKESWNERWQQYREEHQARLRAMGAAEQLLAQRKPNADRITCLRQDELDLAMPAQDSYILRMALGSEASTGWDVYLSAQGFWLKSIDVHLAMTRVADEELTYDVGDRVYAQVASGWKKALIIGNLGDGVFTLEYDEVDEDGNKVDIDVESEFYKRADKLRPLGKAFDIEITGGGTHEKETGLAEVAFDVNKLTPKFRSGLMSTGLSWLTNRDALQDSQHGTLKFKLKARAIGAFDAETGMWEVKLLKKQLHPLKIDLSNQGLINKALSAFGSSIEGLVMDAIWGQLHQLIPRSFAALTSELAADDLQLQLSASVKGGQPQEGGLLELDVTLDNTINHNPKAILDALIAKFDAKTLVNNYFKALIEEQDLKAMWSVNKDAVAAMLNRYGVDISNWVSDDFNETALKERLTEAAKKSFDAIIVAMKPFMNARERGLPDPFEGITAVYGAELGWNVEDEREGRCSVQLGGRSDGEAPNQLRLPRNFFTAISASLGENYEELLMPPREGDPPSEFRIEDLAYRAAELTIGGLRLNKVRLATSSVYNETDDSGAVVRRDVPTRQIWKATGGLRNVNVRIPKDWDFPWTASFEGTHAELSSDGVLTTVMDAPLRLEQQVAEHVDDPTDDPQGVPAKPRSGEATDLTGPVADGFARPMVRSKGMSQTELAPEASASLGVDMKSVVLEGGGDSHMITKVTGTAHAKMNVNQFVKALGTGRPTTDSGYSFFAGEFPLYFYSPSEFEVDNTDRAGRTYKVVLNCGYVRLLQAENFEKEDSNDIVTFDNFHKTTGQWEIDLATVKTARPILTADVPKRGKLKCLVIGTRNWKNWLRSTKTEKPMLCATSPDQEAELVRLQAAIENQVARFESDTDLAKELNFGTHRRYDSGGNELPQYQLPPGYGTQDLAKLLSLK